MPNPTTTTARPMRSILLEVLIILLYTSLIAIVSAHPSPHGGGVFQELSPLARARGIERNSTTSSAEFHGVQLEAERGSAEASYILGLFVLYGKQFSERDEEDAFGWLRKAAAKGHNDARCAVGILLHHGYGRVKADRTAAKSYFRLASAEDHAYGHWLLGRSLFQEASGMEDTNGPRDDKMAEAASLFRRAAEEIPEAAHQLAIMHEYGLAEGEGTTAAELYEKASHGGFVESMYHLALMHAYGRGVPQDYVVATELFRRAASDRQRPHAGSMRYLAIIYANGYSSHPAKVPDYDAALEWYKMCLASEGFPEIREMCVTEHEALAGVINNARAKLQKEP